MLLTKRKPNYRRLQGGDMIYGFQARKRYEEAIAAAGLAELMNVTQIIM